MAHGKEGGSNLGELGITARLATWEDVSLCQPREVSHNQVQLTFDNVTCI